MLLFGGSMPATWRVAVEAVAAGQVGTLMVVGGRGHTTDVLLAAMGFDPGSPDTSNLTEAEVIAAWLREVHGIEDVILETRSTNCGSNITLAQQAAARHGLHRAPSPWSRTRPCSAGWTRASGTAGPSGDAVAVNRPGPDSRDAWPWLRWVSLVMGEVPRLRDAAGGYGPRGRDFIAHVDVPDHVEAAYRSLLAVHPEWDRTVR